MFPAPPPMVRLVLCLSTDRKVAEDLFVVHGHCLESSIVERSGVDRAITAVSAFLVPPTLGTDLIAVGRFHIVPCSRSLIKSHNFPHQ